ncbi:hypothetical protein RvY_13490 [Ramazzottius varieornatus]|uniref:Chromo domain-containing protein n=1 Tax=Ramazzottius varieornatus TaxID=947166 RepID=A0A1D1VWK8_RAMVA|nr:hypothetical protein RvY_13490 [Ramazzottius varieornatus]
MFRKRKDVQPQRTVMTIKRAATTSISLPAPRRNSEEESEVSDLEVTDSDADSQDVELKEKLQSNRDRRRPLIRSSTRQLPLAQPKLPSRASRPSTDNDKPSLPALRATPARQRALAEARQAKQKEAVTRSKSRSSQRRAKKPSPVPPSMRKKLTKQVSARKIKKKAEIEEDDQPPPRPATRFADDVASIRSARASPEIPQPGPVLKRKISLELARLLGDQAEWGICKKAKHSAESDEGEKKDESKKPRRAASRRNQRQAAISPPPAERATSSVQSSRERSPQRSSRTSSPGLSAESAEEPKWEAEQVLSYRLKTDDRPAEVRIRWKGFGLETDSWEPLNNMASLVSKISEVLYPDNKVLVVNNGRFFIVDREDVLSSTPAKLMEVGMTQTEPEEAKVYHDVRVQTEATLTSNIRTQINMVSTLSMQTQTSLVSSAEIPTQTNLVKAVDAQAQIDLVKQGADMQVQTETTPLVDVEVQCDQPECEERVTQMVVVKQEEKEADMPEVDNGLPDENHEPEVEAAPQYLEYHLVSPVIDGNGVTMVFSRKALASPAEEKQMEDEEEKAGNSEEEVGEEEVDWSSFKPEEVSIVGHALQEGTSRVEWLYRVVVRRTGPVHGTEHLLTLSTCFRYFEKPLKTYLAQLEQSIRATKSTVAQQGNHTALDEVQRVRTGINVLAQLCSDPQGFTIVQNILKNSGQEQTALVDDPQVKAVLLRIVEQNNAEDDEEEEED